MPGFVKPTVLANEFKTWASKKLKIATPADTRRGYTDHMEFLSATVLIGYKKYPAAANYPTPGMKAALLAGANLAKKIVRKANDQLAGVLMLRKKESPMFQQVMDTHFGLIAGDDAGGFLTDNAVNKKFSFRAVTKHDRRWALEQIRQKMLSMSFHLNTGMYLIDVDETRRDIRSNEAVAPKAAPSNEEAYVSHPKLVTDPVTQRTTGWGSRPDQGLTCGYKNGEIHISFENIENYSALSYARVIIHEAAHKYAGVKDFQYAHSPQYATLNLADTLDNADSYAWAAMSLYCDSLKMANPGSCPLPDWQQCTKP